MPGSSWRRSPPTSSGCRAARCWRRWCTARRTPPCWPTWPAASCARSCRPCAKRWPDASGPITRFWLDVLGRERLAVVPLHVGPEQEDQLAIALLPRPSVGELPDDRVDAVGRLHWIEEHQIVEARHGRPHRGDRRALVDREALR